MNRLLPFCLVFAGLLLAFRPGHAQPQPYRFDLKAEKLDVPAGPWRVGRVLDLRADRSRLGTVRRGLDNLLASANFTQPLAAEILQFIRAQVPAQASGRPVLMRVFTLALSEDIRPTSEHSEAELIADFLKPQPDSTFRVLLAVGETTRHGGLLDVTKQHPANIALVLQQALRKLAALPIAPATAETLSLADALGGRGGAAAQKFAIQKTTEPKHGFYHSFQEFRDNAPTEPEFPFAVQHIAHSGKRWVGSDEVQVNYLSTDNKRPNWPVGTSGLWGLSDGNELLMVYRGRFYKLLAAPDGHSYTFMGPPVPLPVSTSNVVGAALLGGVAGAAIASSANGPNTMVPYELHLASGRVVPIEEAGQTDPNGFSTQPDTAGVFVYRRPDAGKNQSINFSATSQPATTLSAREWTAITWRDRRKELKICIQLGTGPETCREFVPDFSRPTYLECVVPAGGGPPELKLVSAKEEAFELKRIQRVATTAR